MISSQAALRELADLHGVHSEFFDLHGNHRPTSPETMRALLSALGADVSSDAAVAEQLETQKAAQAEFIVAQEHVLLAGEISRLAVRCPCQWALTTEVGTPLGQGQADRELRLPGLGSGYYLLTMSAGQKNQTARLLVRPARAPDIASKTGEARLWGVTAALYGLRSKSNGGLGNYDDLRVASSGLGAASADFLGINPIHALGWAGDENISPYSPSHRGFFNTDHVAVDDGLGPSPADDLISYSDFRASHRAALHAEFEAFQKLADTERSKTQFSQWRGEQDESLDHFTHFEALSEVHGSDFRKWPAHFLRPGLVSNQDLRARANFHAWLQWRADSQIAEAQKSALVSGMSLGLYLDLAVGPRPGGAEVWMNERTIAKGVTIGAPPDHLSPEGQSWALAAHAPGPLAASFYAPFRAMLSKLMQRSGLLRIDHALGLLRSFWLPDDGSPGGYISQPFASLLAVIAIEAEAAGCVIVGEDLGLVPEGFRETLNASGLYSYSVWQYEMFHDGQMRPADDLAAQSLACFSTHDTPTLRGFWYGEDIDLWGRVGWLGSAEATVRHSQRARQRQSLRDLCGIDPMATAPEISHAIQQNLAQSPAALLAVQLDDVFGLTDAQNLPGTIDEHPNWRRRGPVAIEAFAENTDIHALNDMMTNDTNLPQKMPKTGATQRGSHGQNHQDLHSV